MLLQTQANCTECRIKMEFKKLHQFLQQEEDDRISALKTEEKQKSEKINEKIRGINKEIVLLSDTIKAIKEELRAKDVLFLQVCNTLNVIYYTPFKLYACHWMNS